MFKALRKQKQWRTSAITQKYKKLVLQLLQRKIQNYKVQQYLFFEFEKIERVNNKLAKLKSICFLTGRHRSTYKILGVSRLMMKELINSGFCLGLKKSSW